MVSFPTSRTTELSREPASILGQLIPSRQLAAISGAPWIVYLEPMEIEEHRAQSSRVATISQRGRALHPGFVVVTAGEEVHFSNEDGIYHRFFSQSEPNSFDLVVAPDGEANAVRLNHPGEVLLYCSLHPWERGVVFVTPSPFFTTADSSGRYEIREVPPGRYQLRAWSQDAQSATQTVNLPEGTSVSIEISIASTGERE
jgi:plastocyanin